MRLRRDLQVLADGHHEVPWTKIVGRACVWGYLGDRNGLILRETLSQAMTNSSTIVQIVTWNDFGEGYNG